MKEHLATKGKGSRRSLSSPSVHRVNLSAVSSSSFILISAFSLCSIHPKVLLYLQKYGSVLLPSSLPQLSGSRQDLSLNSSLEDNKVSANATV